MDRKIEKRLRDLRTFFDTIQAGTESAAKALNALKAVFDDALSGRQVNVTAETYRRLFYEVARGSDLSRVNLEKLGESARKAWIDISKLNAPFTMQNPNLLSVARAAGRQLKGFPQEFAVDTTLYPYLSRFPNFTNVKGLRETALTGNFVGNEAILSFFAKDRDLGISPFFQTIKNSPQDLEALRQAINNITQTFAKTETQINAARAALETFNRAIDASKSYTSSFRQAQLPLDQYLQTVNRMAGNTSMTFTGFLESTIGSEDTARVLDDLTSRLKEYGMTLSDVKSIHREASTGITRMTFARNMPLVDPNTGASVDAVNTLNIALSKSGKVLTDTQKRFRDFASAVSRDMGEVLKWAIAVSVIYAPINKLNELMSEMIQNQAKLAEIQIITGKSSAEVYDSFSKIANVASITGESVLSTVESYKMAYIAAGNIRDENLRAATAFQLLSDTLTLSRLSSMSAEESLDILSATLKQLGMSLSEGTILLDKWVAVSKQANVDLQTLSTSFAIISSAAENVGLSIDEINGIIAATSEVSDLSAREVGNMIRAFISGYQTESAIKELDKFGIATRSANGELRGFMEVFSEIKSLSESGLISQSQMARITEVLGGGARRGAQLSAFISNMSRIEQIADISRYAKAGTAMQALETRMKTVDATANTLSVSFSKLAQAVGQEGGILDFLILLNTTLTKVTDSLTLVTKALGSAMPAFTMAVTAFSVLNANKDWAFSLQKLLGTAGYGLGNLVGRGLFAAGKMQPGEEFISISPITREPYTQALRDRMANTRFQMGIPPTISGAEAAGDIVGGRIASFLQRNYRWVLPSALLFATTVDDILSKDFVKAGAEAGGAIVGAIAGKRLLSQTLGENAGPIGMMIGFAVVQGIINASRDNPDLTQAFAKLYIDAKKASGEIETAPEETALDRLIKERDAIEKSMKASAKLINTEGRIIAEAFGKPPARVTRQAPKGLEGFFNNLFNLDVNTEYAIKSFLGATNLSRDEFALQQVFKYADEELVNKYKELNEKILNYQEAITKGTLVNSSNLIRGLVDQHSSAMSKYIADKKEELFSGVGEGVTPSELKSKMESLSGIELKTAQYFSEVGSNFADLIGKSDDIEAAYTALADLLVEVSPQESMVLTSYLANIQALGDAYGKTSKEAEEYRKILASMLALLYKNKTMQEFKMPTVVSGTYTESEANKIAELAKKYTLDFYNAMVPDKSVISAMLEQLTPIAVQIASESGEESGQEFWKKFTDIAPGMFDKARKKLEELGVIGAKDLRIEPYMDFTKEQFMNQVMPVARQFEQILGQAFYGGVENVPQETLGVIFKDGTDKIVVNLLALRLAMDKANELLQKQLDGIYNLPEGAELWVPAQAAELAFQTLKSTQQTSGIQLVTPSNIDQVESEIGQLGDSSNNAAEALSMLPSAIKDAELNLRGLAAVRAYDEKQDKPLNLRGVAAVRAYDEYLNRKRPLTVADVNAYDRAQTSKDLLKSPFVQPGPQYTPTTSYMPPSNAQPVSKMDVTVNTTNQIILDGRVIALTLKRYLARDLRVAASGRSDIRPMMI